MSLIFALHEALVAMESAWGVVSEASVRLGENDMPEPDIFLTSEPDGDGVYPGNSIKLIVEIADSTQEMDLGKKAMMYARGKVPEYWVLDTEAGIAYQHWSPDGVAYVQLREVAMGTQIGAETIAGLSVTLPK
jgi:Uma2 family endonuclease